MHEQMPQLRMGGLSCGHNGATGGLNLPINTALRTADKTVFGLRLLAEIAGIGPDQPTDLGLRDSALRDLGGGEQGEIQQSIGLSGRDRHQGEQKPNQLTERSIHKFTLNGQSKNIDLDILVDKQGNSQSSVGVNIVCVRSNSQR